jgi:hypothetical protein
MRFCTRLRGEPDQDGRLRDVVLLDVSLVDDGHLTGQDEAGDWHIPGPPLTDLVVRKVGGS